MSKGSANGDFVSNVHKTCFITIANNHIYYFNNILTYTSYVVAYNFILFEKSRGKRFSFMYWAQSWKAKNLSPKLLAYPAIRT